MREPKLKLKPKAASLSDKDLLWAIDHIPGLRADILECIEDHRDESISYLLGDKPPRYPMPDTYDLDCKPPRYLFVGAWFIAWSRGYLERY